METKEVLDCTSNFQKLKNSSTPDSLTKKGETRALGIAPRVQPQPGIHGGHSGQGTGL